MHLLDVRVLPPRDKHSTIFSRLAELPLGDTLQIVNDHDPRPLRYQLESEYPGSFSWSYVESGPQTWRVDILKNDNLPRLATTDLLADTKGLSVSKIALKGGEKADIENAGAVAALIFCSGEGEVWISGRTHHVRTGAVELICSGESCRISASSDLSAYVVIAKEHD